MWPEHFHVIANLGHGADGGAGASDSIALFDRNSRRDPFNVIDFGFVHAVKELPGVGRKSFDVAPLAFGKERIEGQGTLSGTTQPSNDDELVQRKVQVEILQVVVANALEANRRPRGRLQHRTEVRGGKCGLQVTPPKRSILQVQRLFHSLTSLGIDLV
jgi:hypothetical protein